MSSIKEKLENVIRRKPQPCNYTPLTLQYPSTSCLVGRETQIAELSSEIEEGAPAVILITGPRGVGKTTLIQTVIHTLKKDPNHIYIDVETYTKYPTEDLEKKLAQEIEKKALDKSLLLNLPTDPPAEVTTKITERNANTDEVSISKSPFKNKKEAMLEQSQEISQKASWELSDVLARLHPDTILTIDEMQVLEPIHDILATSIRKTIQEAFPQNRRPPIFILTGSVISAVKSFKKSIRGAGLDENRLTEIEVPPLSPTQGLKLLIRCLIEKKKIKIPSKLDPQKFCEDLATETLKQFEEIQHSTLEHRDTITPLDALTIPSVAISICKKIPQDYLEYQLRTKQEIISYLSRSLAVWLVSNEKFLQDSLSSEVYTKELVHIIELAIKLADEKLERPPRKSLTEIIEGAVDVYHKLGSKGLSKTTISRKLTPHVAEAFIRLSTENFILFKTDDSSKYYIKSAPHKMAARKIKIEDFEEAIERLKDGLKKITIKATHKRIN